VSPSSAPSDGKSSRKGGLSKKGTKDGPKRSGTNDTPLSPGRTSSRSEGDGSVVESAGVDPEAEAPQHLAESSTEKDLGPRWDKEVDDKCRELVVRRRYKLLDDTLSPSRTLTHVGKSESLITANPASLARFFAGDGAVYAQYDVSRSTFAGGGLPEGWTAVKSRSTSKTYYANASTGEAQWETPLYPLQDDWVAQRTSAGAVYYVNKKTGEWRHDRPVDPDFALARAAGLTAAEAFKARSLNRPDCAGEVLALPPITGPPLALPWSPSNTMRRSHSRIQSLAATSSQSNGQLALMPPSPSGRR